MDNKFQDLQDSIKNLEKKIEKLSSPMEDQLSFNVFEKARGLIKKWIGIWIVAITLLIGYLGFSTIRDIDRVIDNFSTGKIEQEFQSQLDELAEGIMDSFQIISMNYLINLNRDLANLYSNAESSAEQKLKDFAVIISG